MFYLSPPSAVWRWSDQVWVPALRLQPGPRVEVHLARGDREEALQHRLGLLQVTSKCVGSKRMLYFAATPPHSILPTGDSVCATLGSSYAPSTTQPRGPRRAPRPRVSCHKARLRWGIGQIMSLLWHQNVMVKVTSISLHPASNFQIFATRLSGD